MSRERSRTAGTLGVILFGGVIMTVKKEIELEYASLKNVYDKLCEESSKQIEVMIENGLIKLAVPIEKRTKTIKSVLEKIERYNYTKLDQINDMVGIRVIVLFKKDIEKVCDLIEENFQVIRKEDTAERLDDNQFGYGSIHYELKLNEEWCSVPSFSQFRNLSFELQIRTTSQHIWAASSHVLQYKRENDVPIKVKRSINRVAALLELVDLEFLRVLNSQSEYVNRINEDLNDEQLNVDNIKVLLKNKLPADNYDSNEEEGYSELILELNDCGIFKTSELSDFIDLNKELMIQEDKIVVDQVLASIEHGNNNYDVERIEKGVYFTYVGLIRTGLRVTGKKLNYDFANTTVNEMPVGYSRNW